MSDVVMPQLGETVTEGTITKWFKNVGDPIARDELLFEVSTDKVDSEVASPAAGVLVEIRVAEGQTVDVGTVLAVIGDRAAAVAAPPAAPAPAALVSPAPAPPAPAPAPPAEPAVAAHAAAAAPAAPAAASPAPAAHAAAPAADPAPAFVDVGDLVLSPVVRRLINEHGLDPATITGTGVGGRITREDVLAIVEARGATAPTAAPVAPPPPAPPAAAVASPPVAPAPPPAPVAPAPAVTPAPSATVPVSAPPVVAAAAAPAIRVGGRDEVVPFNNIRRRTGEHMVMSKAVSPHAFMAIEIDYHNVDRVRSARKDAWKAEEGFSLTYLPFLSRAVLDAMRKYPHVNASVSGDSLVVHHSAHLGIAVDLDFSGLLVPVVRDADGKRLRAIAREIADLATRARAKRLSADEISGGTFTISNAGPYGTFMTISIINQPQVAILSTDTARKRPVVVELPDGTDAIVVHPVGMIGLSWDHRAFDGAYAASFLHEVKTIMESRDWAGEL